MKYDIDKFFIGELYLSYRIDNLFDNHSKEFGKVYYLYKSNAIKISSTLKGEYRDYKVKRIYEGFLTIFYKIGDKYMCLHNGILYELNGIDFCDNLIPLSNILPKLSYNIPKSLSILEAKKIFNLLFNNKKGFKFNDTKYDFDSFYVGNLVLHEGYLPFGDRHNRYKYSSLAPRYILSNNGAKFGSQFGLEDENLNLHDFVSYKSLFLKQKQGLYNIHSYQFYDKGVFGRKSMESHGTEDFYEFVQPFRTVLLENKVSYDLETMSIPKALKLYNKINK